MAKVMMREEFGVENYVTAKRVIVFGCTDIEVQCNYRKTHAMNILTIIVSPFFGHLRPRGVCSSELPSLNV
jgi:hypothetical protein